MTGVLSGCGAGKRGMIQYAGGLLLGLLLVGKAQALEFGDRFELEAAILGTYQASNDADVTNEALGRIELESALRLGPGSLHVTLSGNTTPRRNGVSGEYDSLDLAGETLNSNGKGRFAATEVFYTFPLGHGELSVGLLDLLDYIDDGEITGEEDEQFMSGAFVDNPTIEDPDFVFGAYYKGKPTRHFDYRLVAASDSGLEEEGKANYQNVFAMASHRDGHRKGAFLATELNWKTDAYWLKGGFWFDTGRVDHVGDVSRNELDYSYIAVAPHYQAPGPRHAHGYGFYGTAGAALGPGKIEARAGIANQQAQDEADFQSVAYQLPVPLPNQTSQIGIGLARTGASSHLKYRSASIYQVEAYWRINVYGPLYVSPDIQYVTHPGFDADKGDTVIGGARVALLF